MKNLNQRQSDSKTQYSGTHLLISGETNLKNYNKWVITKFLHAVRINSDAAVLDFGAGVGTLANIFFESTGVKPDCVELDPRQRAILAQRGFESNSGLDEIYQKYDLIYTSNVLEHIEDDGFILDALKNKLKKNGTLIVFVPAFEVIWSSMDDRVGHCRRYTKKMLSDKLVQNGYIVKYTTYCDSVGFLLSFLFKYIGNEGGEPSTSALKIYDNYLLPISKFVDLLILGMLGKNLMAVAILELNESVYKDA